MSEGETKEEVMEEEKKERSFTITAHSGCEGTRPGSLGSIEVGIEKGAQIVEVDVRVRDEDGVPVLAHDLKEKRHLDAVTLEAALECVMRNSGTVQVNLDLKEFDRVDAVHKVVQKLGMGPRVFFTGVAEADLERVMRAAPGIRLYVNVPAPGRTAAEDEGFYRRLEGIPGARDGEEKLLLGINTHHKNITAGYVEFWHRHGYEVSVFTINNGPLALKIYGCGADNVTTKAPVTVIEALTTGVAGSTCSVV